MKKLKVAMIFAILALPFITGCPQKNSEVDPLAPFLSMMILQNQPCFDNAQNMSIGPEIGPFTNGVTYNVPEGAASIKVRNTGTADVYLAYYNNGCATFGMPQKTTWSTTRTIDVPEGYKQFRVYDLDLGGSVEFYLTAN